MTTNPDPISNIFPDAKAIGIFRRRIFTWYAKHLRDLPWRGTTDPYRIWVSEIMLQQTTTQTVKSYFERFVKRFPDLRTLAETELEQVNRLWEGLGYYRRCAQMHRAAQEIVERFGGAFPHHFEDVLALPGIGRYTAGAICSIAFDDRRPILEANTIRLHARLIALQAETTEKESQRLLWDFAEKILPQKRIGCFNQALMDLGSMVCTPKTPHCPECPVFEFCQTARNGLQEKIPFTKPKEPKEDRTEVALLVRRGSKILLIRHPAGQRWAGLWDFPRCQSKAEVPLELPGDRELTRRFTEQTGRELVIGALIDTLRHVVTRYRITLFFCQGKDGGKAENLSIRHSLLPQTSSFETRWVSIEDIRHLPLNSTARKLFEKHVAEKD